MVCDKLSASFFVLDEIVAEILNNIASNKSCADFFSPIKKVENLLSERLKDFYPINDLILRRAVIAKLALNLPTMISNLSLPSDILSLYPHAVNMLSEYLLKKEIVRSQAIFACSSLYRGVELL